MDQSVDIFFDNGILLCSKNIVLEYDLTAYYMALMCHISSGRSSRNGYEYRAETSWFPLFF